MLKNFLNENMDFMWKNGWIFLNVERTEKNNINFIFKKVNRIEFIKISKNEIFNKKLGD